MSNLQIFRPLGGGAKISADTAIRRARLYIVNKKHQNLRSVDSDTRELILHVLNSRLGIPPRRLVTAFPWSRTVIYNSIANGRWKEEHLKPRLIKPKIDDIVSYLLYNERYLS